MRKLWTVISQTYSNQVKTWSFLLFVLSPFILIGISGAVGYFTGMASDSADEDRIAIVSSNNNLRRAYLQQNKADVNAKITTKKAAQRALTASKIAGYLEITTTDKQISARYSGTQELDKSLQAKTVGFLNAAQQQLNYSRAQLTETQSKALLTQPRFKQDVHDNTNSLKKVANLISFWIVVFMMYMILINYASVTANEIAAEKGTKIMEIIFSSTSPTTYFYGKILGVVGVIITQIALYLVGGWAAFGAIKNLKPVHDILTSGGSIVKQVIGNLVNVNLVFLLLGVIIYTILAAFSGALVSKADDASKAAQPTVYLSMFAFFLSIPFQDNATALLVKVLSYVSFFSSFFMPMRIIDQSASWLEVSLSLFLLVGTIILLAIYIGHIYGGLMLQTDDTSFWRRFKRGLAYSK